MTHLNRYIFDTCIHSFPASLNLLKRKVVAQTNFLTRAMSLIYIYIHILWTVYDLIKYWMISTSLHDLLGTPLSQAGAVQEKMRAPRGRSASCQPGTLESLKWDMCPFKFLYFPKGSFFYSTIIVDCWRRGYNNNFTDPNIFRQKYPQKPRVIEMHRCHQRQWQNSLEQIW